MKRFAAVIAMVLVVVLSTATTCFGLSVTKTTPSDGESGKQITNVAIKFTFSEKVDEKTAEVNKDMFTIKDSEGKEAVVARKTVKGNVIYNADYRENEFEAHSPEEEERNSQRDDSKTENTTTQ